MKNGNNNIKYQTNLNNIPNFDYDDKPEEIMPNINNFHQKTQNQNKDNQNNEEIKNNPFLVQNNINKKNNTNPDFNDVSFMPPPINIVKGSEKIEDSIMPNANNDSVEMYGADIDNDIECIVNNLQFNEERRDISMFEDDYLEVLQYPKVSNDQINKIISTINPKYLQDAKNCMETIDVDSKLISNISDMNYLLIRAKNINDSDMEAVKKQIEEKSNIFCVWRDFLPGEDSFYRAIMFSYLEYIILSRNLNQFRTFFYELNQICEDDYFKKILSYYQIEILKSKVNLILIDYALQMQDPKESVDTAYSLFIKTYNFDVNFDYLLILYLKFEVYKYLKANERKLYTKATSVSLGSLLPQVYKTKTGFNFKAFYNNNLLQMSKSIEKITISVIPFILQRDIYIHLFDSKNITQYIASADNKKNKESVPLRLFTLNNSYVVVYQKDYYDQFSNVLINYSNMNNNANKEESKNSNDEFTGTNEKFLGDIEKEEEEEQNQNNAKNLEDFLNDNDNDNKKPKEVAKPKNVLKPKVIPNKPTNLMQNKFMNTSTNNVGVHNNSNNNIGQNNNYNINQNSNLNSMRRLSFTNNNNNNMINNMILTRPNSDKQNLQNIQNQQSQYNRINPQQQYTNNNSNQMNYQTGLYKANTDYFKNVNYQQMIPNNLYKCPLCKMPNKKNDYCETCIVNITISYVQNSYVNFVKNNVKNIISGRPTNNLNDFINNIKITFPDNKSLSLKLIMAKISDDSKINFNKKLNTFKYSLCLGCFNIIDKAKKIMIFKFPCGCIFCSEKCLELFINAIQSSNIKSFTCPCGTIYDYIQLKYLVYFAISLNMNNFKEFILRFIYEKMLNKCCKCLKEIPLYREANHTVDLNVIEVSDREKEEIFGIQKFNHLICDKCFKVKDQSNTYYCNLCLSEHKIIVQKNVVNGQIRSNCLIF